MFTNPSQKLEAGGAINKGCWGRSRPFTKEVFFEQLDAPPIGGRTAINDRSAIKNRRVVYARWGSLSPI